jgi:xanthine dehydrogenase YagR molybdenum-binding subunit
MRREHRHQQRHMPIHEVHPDVVQRDRQVREHDDLHAGDGVCNSRRFPCVARWGKVLLGMATSGPSPAFKGTKPDDLELVDGRVKRKGETSSGIPIGDVLARANVRSAIGHGKSATTMGGEESKKYSLHSCGAQVAEVTWHPQTARLRVSRFASVIDAGRMLNSKPARNQIEGAVVMGIGMALLEESRYDKRCITPREFASASYRSG